jgi:glycosyltransferase involved in cell wall biosynthesis
MLGHKNILHVVSVFFSIPYFLGEQLDYMNEKKFKVHVISSPSDEILSYSIEHKFKYKEIPILRKLSFLADLRAIVSIIKYIKKNKISVVTGHSPKGALLSMISGYIAKVPKRIYLRHGLVYETAKGFKRFTMKNVDRITALLATKVINVSQSVMQISKDDRLNNSKKNILLNKGTCNGINVKKFSQSNINIETQTNIKRKLGINDDDFVIGFSGRLVIDKGIIELVEAFNLLKIEYLNVKLLLVGVIEERDKLPDSIINLIKNDDRIIHTGYIKYSEIEYYYSLMNIYVLPSYREGFPTSILEASSMELPIITSRSTGCIDAVIDGSTGFHVNIDSNSIFQKIKILIEDGTTRQLMGEKGHAFVIENFRQELVWAEIEKLYRV